MKKNIRKLDSPYVYKQISFVSTTNYQQQTMNFFHQKYKTCLSIKNKYSYYSREYMSTTSSIIKIERTKLEKWLRHPSISIHFTSIDLSRFSANYTKRAGRDRPQIALQRPALDSVPVNVCLCVSRHVPVYMCQVRRSPYACVWTQQAVLVNICWAALGGLHIRLSARFWGCSHLADWQARCNS